MSAVIIFFVIFILLLIFARKKAFFVLKIILRGALLSAMLLFLSTKLPISVGVNPFTASVCGIFGIPGAVLLYIISVI